MKLTLSLIMAVVIGLCFTPAWAAEEAADGSAGLQNQVKWVSPQELQRIEEERNDSDWDYLSDLELYDKGKDSESRWRAAVHLPDGARIVSATWYIYDGCGDAPTAAPIDVGIYKVVPRASASTQITPVCESSSLTGSGYTTLSCDFVTPNPNRTIRNNNGYYLAAVEFNSYNCGDFYHRFSGLKIVYRLQISPAPASHTFWDVPPGAQFYQEIEALAASGITLGCDGHNFCPDRPVTRGQMAAFLARGLGLYWAP
jgi:hypothetical protein